MDKNDDYNDVQMYINLIRYIYTYTKEQEIMVQRLTEQSSLEDALAWLRERSFDITNNAYTNLAKKHGMSPNDLFVMVHNDVPNADGIDLTLVTANKTYGPLSYEQKEEIFHHHQDSKTASLATFYNTNKQNITLAKRGDHHHKTVVPDYSYLTPITPSDVYGPLTIEQKQEIYTHHREVPPIPLAKLYNTNHQNVRLAQKTPHHGKAKHSDTYILTRAAEVLHGDVEVLIALRKAHLKERDT